MIISSIIQSNAAKKAARQQADAEEKARALKQQQFEQGRADLAPYRDIGTKLSPIWQDALGVNGQEGFDRTVGMYRESPGVQFALDEAQRAGERSAAARGGLYSGAAIKAAMDRAASIRDLDFGNWRNELFSGVNLGQNAAAQTANLGANYANSAGENISNIGAANAAGTIGSANALTAGLGALTQFAGYGLGGGFKPGSTLGNLFKTTNPKSYGW